MVKNRNKLISLIAAMSLSAAMVVFAPLPARAAGEWPRVCAQCAILTDARTGQALFEKDADTPRPIASVTKLMTALVVLENAALTETVTVPGEAAGVEGTSLYLKAGDTLTVRELLYGLLLESGNDAAVALAVHVAGSVEAFVGLMNGKAAALGMERTHYVNPHGLTAEGHQSTARDLAKLMAQCAEDPAFVRIASTERISIAGRSFKNHNKLLGSFEGTIAGKTGYTKAAGRTLVTCAERDGMRLVCVTLNDGDDWDDHAALYEAGFAAFERRVCVRAGEVPAAVPVIAGVEDEVAVRARRGACVFCRRGDEIATRVCLPAFVYADVRAGDVLGRLEILRNGEVLDTVALEAVRDVKRDRDQELTFWERCKRSLGW